MSKISFPQLWAMYEREEVQNMKIEMLAEKLLNVDKRLMEI